MAEHSVCLNIDYIQQELTTEYARIIYPNALILILDGTYWYSEKPHNDKESKQLWCSFKYRHLLKTMTICTTTGHFILTNQIFPGKKDDRLGRQKFSCDTNSFEYQI